MSAKSSTIKELSDCFVKDESLVKSYLDMGFVPKSENGMTFGELIKCAQIASAASGDQKSFEMIMDTMMTEQDDDPLERYLGEKDIALCNISAVKDEKRGKRKTGKKS